MRKASNFRVSWLILDKSNYPDTLPTPIFQKSHDNPYPIHRLKYAHSAA